MYKQEYYNLLTKILILIRLNLYANKSNTCINTNSIESRLKSF